MQFGEIEGYGKKHALLGSIDQTQYLVLGYAFFGEVYGRLFSRERAGESGSFTVFTCSS